MMITIAVVVVLVVAVVAVIVATRRTSAAELTPGEIKIRDLVREVYAGNIVSERVVRIDSDAVLVAELRNEKLKELRSTCRASRESKNRRAFRFPSSRGGCVSTNGARPRDSPPLGADRGGGILHPWSNDAHSPPRPLDGII